MSGESKTKQAVANTAPAKSNLPLTEISKFEDFMSAPAVLQRVQSVIPVHLNAERMMRTVALAAYKNPKLRDVHMMSLLGAVMTLASLGLEPNTPLGHAYLIPFDVKKWDPNARESKVVRTDVNVVLGYVGLIDLARRTGSLVSINSKVVFAGDEWSYEFGSNQHLRHRPIGLTEGRKPTHAYAFAKLVDGEAFEVLPYEEALSFRKYSQAFQFAQKDLNATGKDAWKAKAAADTPWIKHEREMVQKTMIRRLSNMLPKSINFASAMRIDQLADAGKVDYQALAHAPVEVARDMLEAGAVPEVDPVGPVDAGDDAPEARPEKKPAAKKAAAPKQEKVVTSNATASPAADPRPDPEPEPDPQPEPEQADEAADVSEDLERHLRLVATATSIEELDGMRLTAKDELGPDEYEVYSARSREIRGVLLSKGRR